MWDTAPYALLIAPERGRKDEVSFVYTCKSIIGQIGLIGANSVYCDCVSNSRPCAAPAGHSP
jgi:hypothetical protein